MALVEQFLSFCTDLIAAPGADMWSFLALGLIAGLFHCSLVCGPILFSLHSGLERPDPVSLLPYHLGRLATYLILAAIAATLATGFFLALPNRAWLIAPALLLAAVLVAATARHKAVPSAPGVARFVGFGLRQINRIALQPRLFLTGMLTGLMPCGMTLAVLLVVMARGELAGGLVMMSSFWLGTTSALLLAHSALWHGLSRRLKNTRPLPRATLPFVGVLWLVGAAGLSHLAS